MIRPARAEDVECILDLLAAAHKVTPLASFVDFDRSLAAASLSQHMRSESSLCLVYDVEGAARGCFVAVSGDHPNIPARMAIEVVSWIDPDYRGKAWFEMKARFETWARERGCSFTSLSSKSDGRFARHLERSGYAPIETHFLKKI